MAYSSQDFKKGESDPSLMLFTFFEKGGLSLANLIWRGEKYGFCWGIRSLWSYRKEVLSLIYLGLLGIGFSAIWMFYDSNSRTATKSKNTLAFEENHRIIDVVIDDTYLPIGPLDRERKPIEETWRTNAVQVGGAVKGRPLISIVIDDLGIVKNHTRSMINLNVPLTLSFLPYAPNLEKVTGFARDRGHELMIHLPMEPKGKWDPGPHAMLTTSSDHKILSDLSYNMSQFDGYVGINNHMGSAFTEDPVGLEIILEEVRKRGLLVLDSMTTQKSLFAKMATGKNIPNVTRDFFLDNEQDVDYILAQLAKLENLAQRRGHAIAIGHPYGETVEALNAWLPTLKEKGIAIVPLSHLVKKKYEKTIPFMSVQTVLSTP